MTAKGVVGALWTLNRVNQGRVRMNSSYLCFKLFIDLVTIRPTSFLRVFPNPFPQNMIITICKLIPGTFRRVHD